MGRIASCFGWILEKIELMDSPQTEPFFSSSDDQNGSTEAPFSEPLFNDDLSPSFNPATGLPMSGCLDVGGNAYGFSDSD
jgi:hypothetical protein